MVHPARYDPARPGPGRTGPVPRARATGAPEPRRDRSRADEFSAQTQVLHNMFSD